MSLSRIKGAGRITSHRRLGRALDGNLGKMRGKSGTGIWIDDQPPGGRLMNRNIAAESAYPGDGRSLRVDASPSVGSAGVADRRLTRRSALMLTLLLSLGLWAAIWAAVASLASIVLG